MSFFFGFLQGMMYTLTFNSPPLFRYPYRNAMESFRSDWKQIGADIESATQSFRGLSEQKYQGEEDE